MRVYSFIALIFLLACKQEQAEQLSLPKEVSYNFDIRPILSDKCFACHGPDEAKQEAGLRLDIREHALAELKESQNAYAIVPGDPEASELIKRVSSDDPNYLMPTPSSHLSRLTDHEIALLTKWIEQGAEYEKHWAFITPMKSDLPKVKNEKWCRNEIDYFILHEMQRNGLSPNPEAEKAHLLKRLSLDLIGMLPTLQQQDDFLQGRKSYEDLIQEFMSQPQYGERMALHWLDVSRYSDSFGYQDDGLRTQWPYRDWVIKAFNENMPYDQFVTWQLAGDMLPDVDKEKILATAFLRNHKYTEEGGVIPEEYRVEYILDKVKTYTKGILGLTMECAQCHDHKYDPFSQKEYFEMFAFFNNTPEKGFEGAIGSKDRAKTPRMKITPEDVNGVLSFLKNHVEEEMEVSVMEEFQDTLRPTFILDRGLYDNPTVQVYADVPRALLPMDTSRYNKDRLGLAKWTFDKDNPLTARVFVNQIWQELFGRGLVNTSGDFGMQGELPSHPELLDWLAVDFMENDWDIQYLLKKILSSATYRQSAVSTDRKLAADPENVYLARAPRIRVKAEIVKDLVMQTSGLMNTEIGGPSVKPYQPKGLWEAASSEGLLRTYVQDEGDDLYRRGMYTFNIKLTVPPPTMVMFDASNRDQCEVKRVRTNTPLQALIMMNDPMILEASRVFANQVVQMDFNTESEIVTYIFRKIMCRTPNKEELSLLINYLDEEESTLLLDENKAKEILKVGEFKHEFSTDIIREAALAKTITLLYNLEETITKS